MKKTCLISFLLIIAYGFSEVRYEVYYLGDVDGYHSRIAYSINNEGIAVGQADPGIAVLFDPFGNGNSRLHGGGVVSTAYSINDLGNVAGYVGGHGVLWYADGGGINLSDGVTYSINNHNQIVGKTIDRTAPVLFDTTGIQNNVSLADRGEAWCINNYGNIVGYTEHTSVSYYQATLFDQINPQNNLLLGGLQNYSDSFAFSINDSGQIVGGVWFDHNTYNGRAVLFDASGSGNNIDLGLLDNDACVAHAINNRGEIVGHTYNGFISTKAILFDSSGSGNNIDLNSLIDPAAGWNLWEAWDINDNGWIVGRGKYQGNESAYVLIPIPEPCTLLLLGMGGWMIRKR